MGLQRRKVCLELQTDRQGPHWSGLLARRISPNEIGVDRVDRAFDFPRSVLKVLLRLRKLREPREPLLPGVARLYPGSPRFVVRAQLD